MIHSGLYWPNDRRLFRRRVPGRIRVALWLVFTAAMVVVAAASLHLQ